MGSPPGRRRVLAEHQLGLVGSGSVRRGDVTRTRMVEVNAARTAGPARATHPATTTAPVAGVPVALESAEKE